MSNGIVFIGDLHLEKLSRWFPKDWSRFQFALVRRTLKWCVKNDVTQIIQLGDLFNTRQPDEETVLKLADLIREYKIRWTIITGNHDRPLIKEHSMKIMHWLGRKQAAPVDVVLSPKVVTIANMKLWLCPHPFIQEPTVKVDLCCGHFPWTGARTDSGYHMKEGHTPKGNWILGDFHEHQHGKRYMYAGALGQTGWYENLPKGFVHGVKTKGNITSKFVPLKAPYILKVVTLENIEQLKELNEQDTFYLVKSKANLDLTSGWQFDYPQIIRHEPLPPEVKNPDLSPDLYIVTSDDPFEGMRDYIKKNHGHLTKRQRKWVMNHLTSTRKQLSL